MVLDPDSSAVPADGSEDAAPGPLRLVQSFANTLSAEPYTDLLRTREQAAVWLRTAAMLPVSAGLTNSEHAALLRLRESVRDVLAAHTDGREDPEAAARLTKALADGRLVLTIDPASTVELASAARASYPGIVAAVAIAIARSAASGTWPRLKSCPAPQCRRAFFDGSASSAARRCRVHAGGNTATGRVAREVSPGDPEPGDLPGQPVRRMMSVIPSALNARSVLERTLPSEPTCSRAATPVSSSGNSAMQTMSYSPTVHRNSRTRPPALSICLEKASARWVVSRKSLMPCSVQLSKETYVAMLVPPLQPDRFTMLLRW
jgi:predicted RNA-binding Zn ribbon-like protein